LTSQILDHLDWCINIRVHPHTLERAYQWVKHCVHVLYGCIKWSEVDISLNHDVMASVPLLK
jgi:hypothetical protein